MSNASLRHRYFVIAAAGLSAVVASLTLSGAAQASDGKTWPATICQRWTGTGNPSASYLDVSQFGRLINKANKRYGVVCPIMRDSLSHKIEEIRVFARSSNCVAAGEGQSCAGLPTRCTMRVMNQTGDIIRSESTKTLVRFDEDGGSVAWLTAKWTNISAPNFGSGVALHNGSTFVMFCEIGVNEQLSGFYLQEGN
jgi:hypothetical protein